MNYDLSIIIESMVKAGDLEPYPENINFRTYNSMVKTAKNKNWKVPTKEQCLQVWNNIKSDVEADQVQAAAAAIEEKETFKTRFFLKVLFYVLKYIKGDLTKAQLIAKPAVDKFYKVCSKNFK